MSKSLIVRAVLLLSATVCGIEFVAAAPTPAPCVSKCSDAFATVRCGLGNCAVYSLPDCATCDGDLGYCRNRAPTPNFPFNNCGQDPLFLTITVYPDANCDEDCPCVNPGNTPCAEGKNPRNLGVALPDLPRSTCPYNLTQPTR